MLLALIRSEFGSSSIALEVDKMLTRWKRSNKSKPAFNILDHLHVYFMNSRYGYIHTLVSLKALQ